MKKLFKSMLFSLLVISSSTTLTSCLGFFEEEVLQISSIQTIELENGDIQVFIIYSDEEIAPTTFVVPKGDAGEDGKDGNGIKEISYELSEDKQNTILNIEFTQQGVNPEKIIIPNGVSVTNIEQSFDEETQMTTLYVNFSDGSKSEPILIPKGEKGEDGATFIPSVSEDGTLSWTNDKGLENPASVNIKKRITDVNIPVPNIIASIGLSILNINNDFFVFAGTNEP